MRNKIQNKLAVPFKDYGVEKRSTRRKKIASPVMTVVIGSDKYAAFEKANKPNGGIILRLKSADNIKKRGRGKPFLGNIVIMLD